MRKSPNNFSMGGVAGSSFLLAVTLILLTCLLLVGCSAGAADSRPAPGESIPNDAREGSSNTKKGPILVALPHFLSSEPAHGSLLAQAPQSVALDVTFYLNPDSTMTVTRDGVPVSLGPVTFSMNRTSMSAPIEGDPGDGVYEVHYKTCWPSRTCHEGSTGFTVDTSISK